MFNLHSTFNAAVACFCSAAVVKALATHDQVEAACMGLAAGVYVVLAGLSSKAPSP